MDRERIFHLAAQHCDAQSHSRTRAVQGWNFSKEGLLAFVAAIRELPTEDEAEAERWNSHIAMERAVRHMRLMQDGETVYGDGVQTAGGAHGMAA